MISTRTVNLLCFFLTHLKIRANKTEDASSIYYFENASSTLTSMVESSTELTSLLASGQLPIEHSSIQPSHELFVLESRTGDRFPLKNVPEGVRLGNSKEPIILHDAASAVEGKRYCRKSAKCERLKYTMCLGTKLPYNFTTGDLAADSRTQDEIQEKLQLWQGLRHVPKCWAVIQPFLCSVYMPKCDRDMVDLPSQEMCKIAAGPCRIVEMEHGWPEFLKCDNTARFPPMCKSDVRELKFNTSAQCQRPLVETDNSLSFYEGVEGCAIQCANPLFPEDEHDQIHQFVAGGVGMCLVFNLFTVVTFLIDWKSANKYPAVVIFYINCCFFVACIGWLAQFFPGAREDIVCRKDGTLRMSEPSAGENLSCVIVFVLVYYFLMAAGVWFVILTYAWHISFQALGKIRDHIDKKGAYFHLMAWSLPLILTITIMALGEIDGNSVSGICFVGYVNHGARAGFLLGPLALFMVGGGYFLLRGLITLTRLMISSQEIISDKANNKIKETIVRMALFALVIAVCVVVTFICHVYEATSHHEWKKSFRKYLTCKTSKSVVSLYEANKCRLESRPSLAMAQLHLLAFFVPGIIMSSWVWTISTFHTWKRFLKRLCNKTAEEPVKLKKHKVIAQAFAKRKILNNVGRLSISFHSTHEDPVGLNFDLNSVASQDISSAWAAGLPKLVTRRGALIATNGSISGQQRSSVDSDMSCSVRRVSVESYRHSLDSQMSVQVAEMERQTSINQASTMGGKIRKRRKREFGRKRMRVGPLLTRRGSTTSQESQLGAQWPLPPSSLIERRRKNSFVDKILSALTIGNPSIPIRAPNLTKRRDGNAGLNGTTDLLERMKGLGFQLPGQNLTSSDDNNSKDEGMMVEKTHFITCGEEKEVKVQEGNACDPEPSTSEIVAANITDDVKFCQSIDRNVESLPLSNCQTIEVASCHSLPRGHSSRTSRQKVNSECGNCSAHGAESASCHSLVRGQSSRASRAKVTSECPNCSSQSVVGSQRIKQFSDVGVQASNQDIATQTSIDIELQTLASNDDSVRCISRGIQVTPCFGKSSSKSQQTSGVSSTSVHSVNCGRKGDFLDKGRVVDRSLKYSYNAHKLSEELCACKASEMKRNQKEARSRSANDVGVGGKCVTQKSSLQ